MGPVPSGWLVVAPEHDVGSAFVSWPPLADAERHSPAADNESVVRLPARMREVIMEALNGQGATVQRADRSHDDLGRTSGDA